MHYMALPVSFRWDEEFVARIDVARGDVPRSTFVRRAIERQITGQGLMPRVSQPAVTPASGRVSPKLRVGIKPRPKRK